MQQQCKDMYVQRPSPILIGMSIKQFAAIIYKNLLTNTHSKYLKKWIIFMAVFVHWNNTEN
jgi:hypothetical protein